MGQVVQEHEVDLIYSVPTVLYRRLDLKLPERYNLSCVKTIRYGAAPMSPSKLGAWPEHFGPVFAQGYGSTECWPSCTLLTQEEHCTETPEQIERLTSVERLIPGEEQESVKTSGHY